MQAGLASTQPRVGCDAWITSPLNRLSHPRFTVWVRILARGERQPRRDAVTGGVLDWLNRLDPDELAGTPATDLPRRHQHAGEWHFDLRVIPMSASTSRSDRGLAGVYPGAPGYDNTASALKTPQGELGLQIPLVWSGICCDRGDIVCRGAGGNVGDRVASESRMSGEGQSQASRSGS